MSPRGCERRFFAALVSVVSLIPPQAPPLGRPEYHHSKTLENQPMKHVDRLDRESQEFLKSLAEDVRNHLFAKGAGVAGFQSYEDFGKNYAYGYFVTIARLGNEEVYLDLWLDLLPRLEPTVSVGVQAPTFELVKKACALLGISRPKVFTRPDFIIRKENWRLREPLPKPLYGRPVLEKYGRFSFVSVYSWAPPAKNLAGQLTAWARRLATAASSARAEMIRKTYDRKRRRTHFDWERSSVAASVIKLKQNNTCQVCGFNFQDFYGPTVAPYAEAHHLELLSLSSSRKKPADPENLTTVCANCHRMLHYGGEELMEIDTLKSLVNKSKAKFGRQNGRARWIAARDNT